ncbi:hypothetical protein C4K12_2942 [Pseudomonas chlororaphis subsp. aureofaciens]|nr:hypothetical protein C4K12_2942 [Pseudomonas chlororaphis subsp. aureofaciens]
MCQTLLAPDIGRFAGYGKLSQGGPSQSSDLLFIAIPESVMQTDRWA